jgi:hypothetical protein
MSRAEDQPTRNDRLEAALVEILEAVESGRPFDRDELIARFPDLAAEIGDFLANRARISQFAQPLVQAREEQPLDVDPGKSSPLGQAPAPPEVGAIVRYFGDYELLEEIARGGMGVVYRARQKSLKRTVALKMILAGQLAAGEDVKRFHAEAEAAARLEHPNIVPIFEIGEADGQHYFSMALVEGESLAHRISRGVLPPREAAQIVFKAARAIAFAHVEGVVHRDLKPANILLDQAGEPHVTDFGLAKRVSGGPAPDSTHALTATGQVLGTPSYMPPEQASGRSHEIGTSADVYALGAVLYCSLTGRPPFQAATPLDTLLQVLQEDPVPPRRLNSAIPRDVETIVMKCLEKEPRHRYGSARELADELERFLNDEPIRARPQSAGERLARVVRKNRQAILRSVVVAAVSLVAVFGAYTGWGLYVDSQSGSLDLKTDGYPLTAEVLDDGGRAIVAPFTVPTEQPVKMPRGEWQVRLSAPGRFGQTYRMCIHQGVQEYSVGLADRQLWKPIDLQAADHFDLLNLKPTPAAAVDSASESAVGNAVARADLLLIELRFGQLTLRRLNGRTARLTWEALLDQHVRPQGVPPSDDPYDWMRFMGAFHYGMDTGNPPELINPSPDVDGDGEPDVVWALRTASAFVAFSGKDGRVLWWSKPAYELANSRVVGMPAVADVNGDGRPDLIAACRADNAAWIEAISGSNGGTIWRFEAAAKSTDSATMDLLPVQLAVVGGVLQAVTVEGGQLTLLRLSDGEAVRLPTPPIPRLASAPSVADFDGDGNSDMFLVEIDPQDRLILHCITLTDGSETWNRPATIGGSPPTAGPPGSSMAPADLGWPLVADLGGDGGPEIAWPAAIGPGARPSYGVEVLAGDTGKVQWVAELYPGGRQVPTFCQLLAAPDVNGDGHREIVVCSTGPTASREWNNTELFVDALSGRDGRRMGTWHRPNVGGLVPETMTDHFGGAAWGLSNTDGWPDLLVTIVKKRNLKQDEHKIHIVALGQGLEIAATSDVNRIRIADLNGDGLSDLCYLRESADGRELMSLAGTPPELWRRLGEVRLADDLDTDGTRDFLEVLPEGAWTRNGWVDVISGRTGQVVRRLQLKPGMAAGGGTAQAAQFLAPPQNDLDGDGTPDLIQRDGTFRNRQESPRFKLGRSVELPLSAVSGRTGRVLWSNPSVAFPADVTAGVSFQLTADHAIAWADDIEADRSPELISIYLLGGLAGDGWQEWLAVLDGRTGRSRWHVPLGQPIGTPRAVAVEARLVSPSVDANGDGVLDLVVVAFTGREGAARRTAIQAINGRDGSTLWSYALQIEPPTALPHVGALLPQPVAADLDGDGHHEIVLVDDLPDAVSPSGDAATDLPAGHPCQWIALDSRDGSVRWTFRMARGHPEEPSPSLIVGELEVPSPSEPVQSGGIPNAVLRWIGVPMVDGEKRYLVIVTAGGQELARLEADGETAPIAVDTDGDGRHEIVYEHGGKLRLCRFDRPASTPPTSDDPEQASVRAASRLIPNTVWEWPPQGRLGAMDSLWRAPSISVLERHSGERPVSLLVRVFSTLTELDANTGAVLYRGEALPDDTSSGIPFIPATWWLPSSSPDAAPIVVSWARNSVGRTALPVDSSGRFASEVVLIERRLAGQSVPASSSTDPADAGGDPRLAPVFWLLPPRDAWDLFEPSDLLMGLVLVVMPGWVALRLVKQVRFGTRDLMIVVAAAAVVIASFNLFLNQGRYQLSANPWLAVAGDSLAGATGLLFPILLLAFIARRQWWKLVWLTGGWLAVCSLFLVPALFLGMMGDSWGNAARWGVLSQIGVIAENVTGLVAAAVIGIGWLTAFFRSTKLNEGEIAAE